MTSKSTLSTTSAKNQLADGRVGKLHRSYSCIFIVFQCHFGLNLKAYASQFAPATIVTMRLSLRHSLTDPRTGDRRSHCLACTVVISYKRGILFPKNCFNLCQVINHAYLSTMIFPFHTTMCPANVCRVAVILSV